MKFYLLTYNDGDTSYRYWHTTKHEANQERINLKRRRHIDAAIQEVEVPIDKQGLAEFLNDTARGDSE